MLFNPSTAAELVARLPTEAEWQAELDSGWPGPNGSSVSLDNIEGIRIGSTTTDYTPDLPANLHDFHYRVIRRLRPTLSNAVVREMQEAADDVHLSGLIRDVAVLVGWNGWKARQRARGRWFALRLFGWRSTRRFGGESYPDAGPAIGGPITCPRRMEELGPWEREASLDAWVERDGRRVCTFCGSMDPDEFLRRVASGEKLIPTDKNYKAYVGPDHAKVYFQHFDDLRRHRLIERLNDGSITFGHPGHFYVLPFFIARES